MKYLLLIVFLAVIWSIWKKRQAGGAAKPAAPAQAQPENMLICAHCGVHFPEGDGLLEDGKAYCSEAHRQAAQSAGR